MRKSVIVLTLLICFTFVNTANSYTFLLSPIISSAARHFGRASIAVGIGGLGAFVGGVAGEQAYVAYNNIVTNYLYKDSQFIDSTDPSNDGIQPPQTGGFYVRTDDGNLYNITSFRDVSYNCQANPVVPSATYYSSTGRLAIVREGSPSTQACSAYRGTTSVYNAVPETFNPADVDSSSTSDLPLASPAVPSGADVIDNMLDLSKGLAENLEIAKAALDVINPSLSSVLDIVSIAQILGNLPSAALDSMPLQPWERNLIDSVPQVVETVPDVPLDPTVPQTPLIPAPPAPIDVTFPDSIDVTVTDPVSIADVPVPSIPDIPVYPVPDFDTTFDVPDSADWFSPVVDFFDSVTNSVPFIALFKTAEIESSGSNPVVVLPMMGNDVSVNFSDYESVLTFMSFIIIFGASVWAVLIIVER